MKNQVVILGLFLSSFTHAQDVVSKRTKVDLYYQIHSGSFVFKGDAYTALRDQFSNTQILGDYTSQTSQGSSSYVSTMLARVSFGAGIPVKIFKTDKFQNTVRANYDGFGKISLSSRIYDEERVRLDSTYYPQYDASLMKDSVYVDRRAANVSGRVHQIRTDLLFRFRPEKRLTLYSGLGIGMAFTTNRSAVLTHNVGNFVEVSSFTGDTNTTSEQFQNSYYGYYPEYEDKLTEEVGKESYKLSTGYSFFTYIPFGMDWQIGKNNKFLSRFYLYTEGQLGARFADVYLNTNQLSSYFSILLGLRFSL